MNIARPWIAVVSVADWTRIHEFCREHDIATGSSPWHMFDAPTGGAINCWTIDESHWQRMGELRGTFYPERSDGQHPGIIIEDIMAGKVAPEALLRGGFMAGAGAVIVRFSPANPNPKIEAEVDAAWSIDQASEFFNKLHLRVLQRPLPAPSPPAPQPLQQ